MRTQYGLSVYSSEFQAMKWDEFKALLSGLSGDTPLGRIVQIRSEDDKSMLDGFSAGQHKIRNDWRKRLAKQKTEDETAAFLEEMKKALMEMAK